MNHRLLIATLIAILLLLAPLTTASTIAFAETTTEAFLRLSRYDQIELLEDIISRYQAQGVEVKLTSAEYLHMINNLLAQNPDYSKIPLRQIIRGILIAEGSLPNEKAKGPPGTLLTFLSFFAGGTLLLLVLVALSGGALPQKIESIIFNTALGIIITTILLWLYRWTSHIIFLILIPVTICAIIYTYVHQMLKNYYKRKYGKPSTPDVWLCRKCGAENENINLYCTECDSSKGAV